MNKEQIGSCVSEIKDKIEKLEKSDSIIIDDEAHNFLF